MAHKGYTSKRMDRIAQMIRMDGKALAPAKRHCKEDSLKLHSNNDNTLPGVVVDTGASTIQRRYFGHQYIGQGWHVRYKVFTPFGRSQQAALGLCLFWTNIALQVTNTAWMPDDQFLHNTFKLKMALGDEMTGIPLTLVLEVFNFDGPVPRQLVKEVAAAMMGYTLRGFYGTFNAWLSQGPGRDGYWITLTIQGLEDLRTVLRPSA
ncbi:MAG: hypothetical protein Q9218_006444 [Villophora microphyllina]